MLITRNCTRLVGVLVLNHFGREIPSYRSPVPTNLVSPPHHQVGEHSNPQDGANERHGEVFLGCLENEKEAKLQPDVSYRETTTELKDHFDPGWQKPNKSHGERFSDNNF